MDLIQFIVSFKEAALIVTVEGKPIDCNYLFCNLFKMTREEVKALSGSELFRLFNIPNFSLESLLQSQSWHMPFRGVNQYSKTVRWNATPISDNEKNLVLLTAIDISELTQKIFKAENTQHSIIDLIPEHFICWKDKNFIYRGCNQAMANLLGLNSSSDIIGKTDYDLPTTKEQSDAYRADDQYIVHTGKAKLRIEEQQTINGEQRVILTSKAPLFDEEGNVEGIVAIYSDITEQKNMERALKKSMKKDITALKEAKKKAEVTLADLIRYAPGLFYWKDKNSVYLGCNDEFAKLAGLDDRSEVIGKRDYDLIWHERAQLYIDVDQAVMKTGKPILNHEEKIEISNCQTITAITNKVPLRDSKNNVIGMMGITTDITALKNAQEKAEAANQAKTEFLDNMRHDIRTPLTGIVGFSDILKMESKEPIIKEYAENLVASSHALLDLLDEVLEAIRVSSGEIPKLKKKFNLKDNLESIIKLNRAKAAAKNINLSLEIDSNIPTYVIGDKIRIHRVALELVANALNFTDKGYVKLSVKLGKLSSKLGTKNQREFAIVLTVEDSGIGIPKDKQHEIYLQFKRLTPSYRGIYKGAGLGLSVVKQFIDELEAEIYVESEPRKGTCFTVIIPLQEPLLDIELGMDDDMDDDIAKSYETMYAQQITPPTLDSDSKEYRVLVVEDNSIAQSVAKSILAQSNCTVDIAECGKKAVEMWKTHVYDLIFMDIGLPDIDGYEVTHVIRVQELPKKTHVPIIALTAHAGDENKKRCIDAGMNAVLTKPLTAKSCADIVDAFIPGRQLPGSETASQPLGSDLPELEEDLFNLSPYPLLDVEEGVKTTGDELMLAEMLRLLMEGELQSDLQKMKTTFAENNWDKTQELAHKIKGGAVYVGTIRMKMACQYLERYWKAGHKDLFEKLFHQSVAVIEETLQEIAKWLQDE